MSDFTHANWSIYVAALTLVSIVACLILLWVTARKKMPARADNTTGHMWDEDLSEMNNPMPRWWMWLFVITIVWGLAYLVAFPGLGAYQGMLGWTSQNEYTADMEQAQRELEPRYARFASMKVEDLAADAPAKAVGESLFMNNCAQCHGSDARGSKGLPNLADKDWLYGGAPENIMETITKGRTGVMPPMAAAVGTPDDVKNLANYVMSLSGGPHDSVRAGLGKSKFTACAACHGPGGKGIPAIGAPNLSDDVWLHGYGQETIIAMVNTGKTNQMPAQGDKLSAAQIRVLTAYVWGLSNRPAAAKP